MRYGNFVGNMQKNWIDFGVWQSFSLHNTQFWTLLPFDLNTKHLFIFNHSANLCDPSMRKCSKDFFFCLALTLNELRIRYTIRWTGYRAHDSTSIDIDWKRMKKKDKRNHFESWHSEDLCAYTHYTYTIYKCIKASLYRQIATFHII